MEKVHFAVLGCANIARKSFIPGIRLAKNAVLDAVGSRSLEKGKKFAAANGIERVYGSYEELLACSDIDAVYAPLPNGAHKEWAIKAMRAGKHVLCEKPLAPTPEECYEMGAVAEECGVCLMEDFMYRFHPLTEYAIRTARSGALGKLTGFMGSFSFVLANKKDVRYDPALAGGALMDVGCYPINCSRTLFGQQPEALSATAVYTADGIDDQMDIIARYPDGKTALINCGFNSDHPFGYTVYGEKGFIQADNGYLMGVNDGTLTQEIDGKREVMKDSTNEYTRIIEHFADCVLNHKAPRYDYREAALNMAVINAAQKSARSGGAWTAVG